MGKWKAFIPIILALIIAAGGSVFLYNWLQAKTTDEVIVNKEDKTVTVAVSALELPWGTKLTSQMMKQVPFLKESLPVGFHSDPKALEGRILIAAVKEMEPILEYKLAPENISVGGVAAILKDGKRAIAVKGDKVIGISGFIQPGNRVDVLVTIKDPKTKGDVTKLVLENILVLATGTEIQEKEGGKPSPVDVYTLEVDPEQGEKLALAATKGKLQFALRNLMDTKSVRTKGATVSSTLSSLLGEDPKNAKQNVKKYTPRYTTVETLKGTSTGKQKFQE
ncbi:MAG: Flp pilus assembly protein CpaB [Desulfobacterales bacterium]